MLLTQIAVLLTKTAELLTKTAVWVYGCIGDYGRVSICVYGFSLPIMGFHYRLWVSISDNGFPLVIMGIGDYG